MERARKRWETAGNSARGRLDGSEGAPTRRSDDGRGVGKRRASAPARRCRPPARPAWRGPAVGRTRSPWAIGPEAALLRRSREPRRGVSERRVGVRRGGAPSPAPPELAGAAAAGDPGEAGPPSASSSSAAQAWGGAPRQGLGRPGGGPSRRAKRPRPARAGRRRRQPRPGRRRRAIRPEARSSPRRPGRRGWPEAGERGA